MSESERYVYVSNEKFVGIRSPHVSWLPFRAFFRPSACLCFLIQRRFIQLFRGSTEELKKEEIPGEKSSHFILPGYVQFRYPLNGRIARITFKDKSNTQTMHYYIPFLNTRYCKWNSLDGESKKRLQKILKRARKTSKLSISILTKPF